MATTMTYRPDIIIQDKEGKTVALIEVKGSRSLRARDAAHYYKEFRASGLLDGVRFFVVVTRSAVFLWDQHGPPIDEDLANQEAMTYELPKFLEQVVQSGTYDERSLTYGVLQWLLSASDRTAAEGDPAEKMLEQAGFLAAIRDGAPILQPAE